LLQRAKKEEKENTLSFHDYHFYVRFIAYNCAEYKYVREENGDKIRSWKMPFSYYIASSI
jgi:hypothetical protein